MAYLVQRSYYDSVAINTDRVKGGVQRSEVRGQGVWEKYTEIEIFTIIDRSIAFM